MIKISTMEIVRGILVITEVTKIHQRITITFKGNKEYIN